MKKKSHGLSSGQLTMMALGTVIGGSFFLGSAVAVKAAGPSIIISYILGGILIYFILKALSEMTVANPDSGSFRAFAGQTFGPAAGFTVGWVYWTGMVLAMSSEATAVSILIREWLPGVPISILGSTVIIVVTLLNLLGADKLSKLESGLAAVKLFAIASFIILAVILIIGLLPGAPSVGVGELGKEPFMPGGIRGIAGSMLIVIFSYAGFEIIGLAASEADNPRKTVPKAITLTVVALVGFYIASIAVLLPLIPTAELNESVSPMVAALNRWGVGWAGSVINIVLITAILSTMLAAMFGVGRMLRSLAAEGHAPHWLKEDRKVPYRGILFSGFSMLVGLGIGLLLPRVYLFLVSSGGFSLLFTYAVIMATHISFRKKFGCPPEGKCQMPGYPVTSWLALLSLIVIILSMPFIPGQAAGMVAGVLMVIAYILIYISVKVVFAPRENKLFVSSEEGRKRRVSLSTEFSKELIEDIRNKNQARGEGEKAQDNGAKDSSNDVSKGQDNDINK